MPVTPNFRVLTPHSSFSTHAHKYKIWKEAQAAVLQERSFQKELSFSYYLFLRLGNINSGYPNALYWGYLLRTYFLTCMLGLKSCAIMSLKNCYDCFCFNSVFFFPAWRSENIFLGVHSVLHLVGTDLSILPSYCILQITTCPRSPLSTVSLLPWRRSAGIRDACHPNKLFTWVQESNSGKGLHSKCFYPLRNLPSSHSISFSIFLKFIYLKKEKKTIQ